MARNRKRGPGLRTKIANVTTAAKRWQRAGRPVREEAVVRRMFEAYCRPCKHYVPSGRLDRGSCGLCGCRVNLRRGINKLRWATESCPDTPPKFTADVDQRGRKLTEEDKHAMSLETRRRARHLRRIRRAQRKAAQAETPEQRLEFERQIREHEQRMLQDQQDGKLDEDPDAQRRRGEKQERRRKRKKRWAPPLHEFPPNDDPLLWTDRWKNPIGHLLRDLWRPNPGFLVCGGPSLQQIDLSFLRERGIVSLGINNVSGYAPVRAMTFSDPPEKFCHGVFFDPAVMKLVPVPKLGKRVRAKRPDGTFSFTSLRVQDCPNVWGYRRNSVWDPETFLTSENASWGNGKKGHEVNGRERILFTFFLGLRLLHYLGCRQVYMIGADFSMLPTEDGRGQRGYAFTERRHEGAARGNNSSYRKANAMCHELRPIFDAAGFEVYNCNPDSHLTAFDYVPLETAIRNARGLVPPEPWPDEILLGWYSKDEDPENRDAGD